MTDIDYPGGALRLGEQGVTGFSLTIAPDGRVRDCVVTRTSGSVELDRATCAKVSAGAVRAGDGQRWQRGCRDLCQHHLLANPQLGRAVFPGE